MRERSGGVEQSDPLAPLALCVPTRDEIDDCGEEGALAQPDKEPDGIELGNGPDGCRAEGEDGPEDFQR